MLIPVFVGVFSGGIGTACWLLIQHALAVSGAHSRLADGWWLMPPLIGCFAAVVHTIARALQSRGVSDRSIHATTIEHRRALADVFESYHFGIFVLHPFIWLARGLVSLVNAVVGGSFGLEGGILELSFSALPILTRYARLFIEEKQTFVICTISSSLAVALGAPFTGALIALELAQVIEPRVRVGAVVSALTAYGTSMLLQATVLSSVFVDSPLEHFNFLGTLFGGMRTLNLETYQWMVLSLAAFGVGIAASLLALATAHALDVGAEFFSRAFSGRFQLGMILTGLIMGLSVKLVPGTFVEPWRAWEELAWLRVSTPKAVILLVANWSLLVLAFSGWGSTGVFSPMLLLGALLGYACGNSVGSSWALPLAVAGASASLATMFRTPVAAAALVLEVGRDGPRWYLSALAVLSSTVVCQLLSSRPFHLALLERMGVRIVGGRAVNVLARLKTSDAMSDNFATITENSGLGEMRAAATSSRHNFIGVLSAEGKYLGLLPLEQLPGRVRQLLREDSAPGDFGAIERVVEIRDLVDALAPTVKPTDTLESVIELFEDAQCLAVVDDDRRLKGFLFESAVAGVYKREIAGTVIKGGLLKS